MPVKRALVECAVLSLQDSRVFYPCCKGCFSRTEADSTDTRLTCSKCGYRCARNQVDYRYRLSIRVARGSCVFGVTVFGNCLNPFFGIHASGLQRLVADISEPLEALSKSTLLVKAVEECFIGKHFIFGIKVTESENEPWVGRTNASRCTDMAQLIATQMILPKAAGLGLGGCTVLNYYEAILRKAAENKLHLIDACKTFIPQGKPLLSISQNSPTTGFTNDTLCSSSFLPLSLSRSQHQDSSLSPTPPWQQTLGLITSSAEQEETQNYDNKSPSCIEKDHRITIPLNPLFDLSPSAHKTTGLMAFKVKDISTPDITKSILTSTIALEEFPLSESLTEFLNEKNRPENQSQENKFSMDSRSVCQKKIQIISRESNVLSDVSHRAAVNNDGERHPVIDHTDDVECVNRSQAGYFCSSDCNKKTEATCEPTEASEDEQFEGSVYDCSADLFSSSPRMDMYTTTVDNPHFESITVQLSACKGHKNVDPQHTVEASSLLSKQNNTSEKAEKTLTPDNDKMERDKHSLRESFPFSTNLQPFDFIPPSQSTPAEKETAHKRKCVQSNLLTKHERESVKEEMINSANHTNYYITPKSRYRKSDKLRYGLLTHKHHSARRGVLNTRLTIYKRSSSGFEDKDNELIVPPTPANPMTSILKNYKSNHSLDYTLNSTKDYVQTEYRPDSKSAECGPVVEGLIPEYNNADEECDWSRDLFSDSV